MPAPPALERPTPEHIAALPVFELLPPDRIHLLRTPEHFELAAQALRAARHVGFDTESKPSFVAGVPLTGPDLVQFATDEHAFLVQSNTPGALPFLRDMIEGDAVVKVGFGLASDRPQLQRRFGLTLGAAIDLSFLLRQQGYRQAVGLKMAVAIVLGQRLPKSKKVTTSNWAAAQLSAAQLLYAANDAYASLKVFQGLHR